ncbi:hypothetical protein H4R27_004221 [Coemansia aciculifera]|nr:hypothetical protein H4R27_004221 [Coemansia aciculifera]
MGNGNKAQMKRERNAKAGTEAKSQLKINVASKTIQCKFQNNKHSKTLLECFPEHKENETKSDNKPNAKVSGKK